MASEVVSSIPPACSLNDRLKQSDEVSREKEEREGSSPNMSSSNISSSATKEGEGASRISEEETSKALPEDLVETILSMVPFPFIFKARILSKSWQARLSPISSQADEEKKQLAMGFQRKVSEWSPNWPTFCPVINNGDYFAYERGSQAWRKLPPLDFLPSEFFWNGLTVEGSLFLFTKNVYPPQGHPLDHGSELCVANILTRCCRILPTMPTATGSRFYRLVSHTTEYFKVISVHALMQRDGTHQIYVYDSRSGVWTLTQEIVLAAYGAERFGWGPQTFGPVEYLDGVLYVWSIPFDQTAQVLAINVEEESSQVLDVSLEAISDPLSRGNRNSARSREEYILFKFDLRLRRLVEVARGCLREFEDGSLPMSDDFPRVFYLVVNDGRFYRDERRQAHDDESKVLACIGPEAYDDES